MKEDSFFDALYCIMWDMEIDIFSERERTCGILSDLVPKCKKELRRFKTMYECQAMDYIEKAVAEPNNSDIYLTKAVSLLISEADMSTDKALQAVNSIAALWDSFPQLESYNADDENYEEIDVGEFGGEEEMLFLNDVPDTEEAQEEQTQEEQTQEEAAADSGDDEGSGEPRESIIKKLVLSWCKGDTEDGRPHMFACPIGWIMIIFSAFLGIFMAADITYGDKLVIPVFAFTFTVLVSKRLYQYDSAARLSLMMTAFYIIAVFRSIWDGSNDISYLCVPLMIAAFIVFNNGRISSWLDESKRKPIVAYLIITLFSVAVTAGAYAIQNVSF